MLVHKFGLLPFTMHTVKNEVLLIYLIYSAQGYKHIVLDTYIKQLVKL